MENAPTLPSLLARRKPLGGSETVCNKYAWRPLIGKDLNNHGLYRAGL